MDQVLAIDLRARRLLQPLCLRLGRQDGHRKVEAEHKPLISGIRVPESVCQRIEKKRAVRYLADSLLISQISAVAADSKNATIRAL